MEENDKINEQTSVNDLPVETNEKNQDIKEVKAEEIKPISSDVIEEKIEAVVAPLPVADTSKEKEREEKKAQAKAKKEEEKRQKKLEKKAKADAIIENLPKEYRPISVSKYFWLIFLSFIPVLGPIITIFSAFIGTNKNRKNLQRSILAYYVVFMIITLCFLIILYFADFDTFINLMDVGDELTNVFGAFSF